MTVLSPSYWNREAPAGIEKSFHLIRRTLRKSPPPEPPSGRRCGPGCGMPGSRPGTSTAWNLPREHLPDGSRRTEAEKNRQSQKLSRLLAESGKGRIFTAEGHQLKEHDGNYQRNRPAHQKHQKNAVKGKLAIPFPLISAKFPKNLGGENINCLVSGPQIW